MALEQLLRLVLVACDLQGVSELGLILARLQVPADAADSGQQKDDADHDAEHGHTDDETGGPCRARGRLHAVCVPVAPLDEEQAVKVGAHRLVGGRQPRGERGGRMGCHARRAEEIADGDPLVGKLLDSVSLSRRIVGVEPHEDGELGVSRRKKPGVQRAEEP